MKKLLTLALTGVLAAAALAVESEPSNTVGFISRTVNPNTYTSFSACPMGLGTAVPALNVIGGQGATGDKVLKFTNAWSTTMATFTGAAGFKPFGNPLPLNIDLDTDDLTLDADGFNSGDKILDWTGAWTTYTYNGTTYGVDLMAGKSYIFRIAAPFTWEYTIPTGAVASEGPVVRKAAKSQSAAADLK